MPPRRSTPQETVSSILEKSRRRCCLCVFLQFDPSVKRGQIAHIDSDPSNNKESNLVFLCLRHHDEFDGTFRQSKGISRSEVRSYKRQLEASIGAAEEDDKVSTHILQAVGDATALKTRERLRPLVPRAYPIPGGSFLIRDEDGRIRPLPRRVTDFDAQEGGMGGEKTGEIHASFNLTEPVSLALFILFCLYTGYPLVGQWGASRSHRAADFSGRHFARLLLFPGFRLWLSGELLNMKVARYCGRRMEGVLPIFDRFVPDDYDLGLEERVARMARDYPRLLEPVVNLNWFEAQLLASWLSSVVKRNFHLPSEGEWMRATQYIKREHADDLEPIKCRFGSLWYWTSDWYSAVPSRNVGSPILTAPRIVAQHEWKVLKSFQGDQFHRGGVFYRMRAINHGVVLAENLL